MENSSLDPSLEAAKFQNPSGIVPVVSVVIPTYNSGCHLAEAIKTVLNQDLREFEILVVDDGSTDDTAEVISPFQRDSRVRYLPRPHRGVSAARNAGIQNATGRFVAFLDADDRWPTRDKLTMQAEFLDNHADVGWILGEERHLYEDGRIVEMRNTRFYPAGARQPVVHALSVEDVCRRVGTPTSSIMVRRSCLLEVGGFDEALRMYEDLDLWIRLPRQAVALIPNIVVDRKRHQSNYSQDRFRYGTDLQRLTEKHSLQKQLRWAKQRSDYQLAHSHLRDGNYSEARIAFLNSLSIRHPGKTLMACLWLTAINTVFRRQARGQQHHATTVETAVPNDANTNDT